VRLRSIGLFAVLVLVIASCGSGSPEAGDSSEGIQVHGDWTIDIYNKDGSLDQHVEFSNALKDQGAHDLISALAGLRTFSGDWQILLEGLVNDPCPSDLFPGCLFSGNRKESVLRAPRSMRTEYFTRPETTSPTGLMTVTFPLSETPGSASNVT
jgi:hypothetical protein